MIIFRIRFHKGRTRKTLKHDWSESGKELPRELWAAKGPGL